MATIADKFRGQSKVGGLQPTARAADKWMEILGDYLGGNQKIPIERKARRGPQKGSLPRTKKKEKGRM